MKSSDCKPDAASILTKPLASRCPWLALVIAPLYWEDCQGGRLSQAVRLGDLKALRPDPNAPVEVYDLNADPGETRDRAADHPDLVEQAQGLFRTAREENEHWPLDRRAVSIQPGIAADV